MPEGQSGSERHQRTRMRSAELGGPSICGTGPGSEQTFVGGVCRGKEGGGGKKGNKTQIKLGHYSLLSQ